MSLRRRLSELALVAIPALAAGCQTSSSASSAPLETTPAIELRDAAGKVTARVTPGHPCRATIDGVEMLIGTQPLVAQLGDVRWTGDQAANGLTIRRNDAAVARISPSDQPDATGLFTTEGVAIVRATVSGAKADLISGAGAIVGSVTKLPKGGIAIGDRVLSGTDDLLLAALLTAPDTSPEVRGLAACHRLFPSPKAL
ncbi:hypothetical protein BH11MYX3_BH11MYX3_23650 [soil metagenome]